MKDLVEGYSRGSMVKGMVIVLQEYQFMRFTL